MNGYVGTIESNTAISFKICDKKQLKKYNRIWKRVEKLLKIEFDCKPIYGDDDKYITKKKKKKKMHGDRMFTNFQGKKIPKGKAPCKCLSVIMLDSVSKQRKSIIHKDSWKNVNMNKKK